MSAYRKLFKAVHGHEVGKSPVPEVSEGAVDSVLQEMMKAEESFHDPDENFYRRRLLETDMDYYD